MILVALIVLVGVRLWYGPDSQNYSRLLSIGWLLLVLALAIRSASYRPAGTFRKNGYWESLLVPGICVFGSHAILWALTFGNDLSFSTTAEVWSPLIGSLSMLEVTTGYIVALCSISIVFSWICIFVISRWCPVRWHEACRRLLERDRLARRIELRRIWSLVSLSFVSLVWWNYWVAPALYGGNKGFETLQEKFDQFYSDEGSKEGETEN